MRQRQAQSMMTAERLYDLVLLATDDREQADQAACAFMAAQLRTGETPG